MVKPKRLSLVREEAETRLEADARAFDYHLDAEEKSPATRRNYGDTLRLFHKFCLEHNIETDTKTIGRQDVEWWMKVLREKQQKSSTRHLRYASLQAFFTWAEQVEIIDKSPMKGMRAPRIIEEPPAILTEDEVRNILKVAAGNDFKGRRDTALIRLFIDSGARLSEITTLRTEDWLPRQQMFRVKRKGNWHDTIDYKTRTAAALDRYWRIREKQLHADSDAFWITSWGRLSADGVSAILREIGTRAGVHLTAHRFRHLMASDHLASGGEEGDLLRRGGWRDRSMIDRYAKADQKERAKANFQKLRTIGDRV